MKIKSIIFKVILFAGLIVFSAFVFLPVNEDYISVEAIVNKESNKVHAPFNKKYSQEDLGQILSWIDCGKALSAVGYHKGLMVAPMSFDFGGGIGDGAFAAYNIDNPRNPVTVFDSRDYPELYHVEGTEHYLGDLGEHHGLYYYKDMMLFSDRGKNHNGFLILDIGPLYDEDPKTLPKVVCRYQFPEVEKSTVYDGFTFAPAWVGGKYVYAPTGSNGLFIISTENFKEPKLLSHLRKNELYNQTIRSVHAIGDLLVLSPAAVATAKGEMVLMDVSDPKQPNLINHHRIKIGYQGILYGNRFYNGAFSGEKNVDKISKMIAYDFTDPMNIKEIELGSTDKIFKPEYMYLQDDNLYIGHYPGLTRWDVKDDKASSVIEVEPQHPPGNDYAFVSPLGNLSIITSDHEVESKLNLGVHQLEPDLKDPEVRSVYPKNGTKNVSLLGKIGISFSDFIDNECLENGAVYVKEKGTDRVVDCGFSHGMGIVHAIPKKLLKKNTSYEVYVTTNLMDMVGNPFKKDTLVTQFSTGSEIVDYSSQVAVDKPKEVGEDITIRAIINNKGKSKIQYSWDFGDGQGSTPFSSKTSVKKTFSKPGNYGITLTTKEEGNDKLIKSSAVQVVYEPLRKDKPIVSSTVLLDDNDNRFYVVNPDNNSFTAFNTKTGAIVYEKPTGKEPTSIIKEADELWISCAKSDAIYIHDLETGKHLKTIDLGYGSAPYGLILNKKSKFAYVALSATNTLQEIDTDSYKLLRNIQLEGPLRHVAFVPKKNSVVANQFMASNQKGARVQWVDVTTWEVSYNEVLKPTLIQDGLSNGRGYPNYLGAMAINPQQTDLWIPAKKDNLFRGLKRDGNPLIFDHTVRSTVINIDLDKGQEVDENRLDLDNSDFATAATYNAFGNILYVVTLGSQTITSVDAFNPNNQSVFNTYGDGAKGLVGNNSGTRLYIHNQLSRSIAVFESQPNGELKFVTKWKTVTNEKMDADVLDGKRIFNRTNISNLSREGYMSCASCHIDGSHDGRIWDLSSLGEGLRNTIDLRGKDGMKHGTLHWSANFDEVQDFDDQIRNLNEGTGFLYDVVKKAHKPLFPSKSGLHVGLDNLAKYVTSLSDYPKSPYRNDDGIMTKAAKKGRSHFIDLECYTCHSGPTYTDSGFERIHDVGTITENSGKRLKKELTGIDTPTLISIWQSAPYLHDGSAETLDDVFNAGTGELAEVHTRVNTLNKKEKKELTAFLMQLDSENGITPDELGSKNEKPKFDLAEYRIDYNYKYQDVEYHIGKVNATDADKDQKLVYRIIPSVYAQQFTIDSLTGDMYYKFKDLYLKNISNMVLTTKKTFKFQVLAEDNGKIVKRDTTNIIFNVTFPNIPIRTQELNELKRLHLKVDKGVKLNQAEQKRIEELDSQLQNYN